MFNVNCQSWCNYYIYNQYLRNKKVFKVTKIATKSVALHYLV